MKKNTGKAPSIQFYYKDFLADMAEHDPDIIGAWMLVLIKIWHTNNGGSVTKTLSQFAKIMNTDQAGARRFVNYFKDEKIANVTEDNERITIVNRRTERDAKLRKDNRLRQKKFRGNTESNAPVTDKKGNPSNSNSNSSSDISISKEKLSGKLALEWVEKWDRKLEALFGPLLPKERKTFYNIRTHLLKQDAKITESSLQWMMDAKSWAEDNGHDNIVAKKCFVKKCKELSGFTKKAE